MVKLLILSADFKDPINKAKHNQVEVYKSVLERLMATLLGRISNSRHNPITNNTFKIHVFLLYIVP
jgi:hypothetical protein